MKSRKKIVSWKMSLWTLIVVLLMILTQKMKMPKVLLEVIPIKRDFAKDIGPRKK